MSIELKSKSLSTTRLEDGRRELNRKLVIVVDGVELVVPRGFKTDLSSYPGFTRMLVRFDRVDIAGVVHDMLYFLGEPFNRAGADKAWRKIALAGDHHANAFQAWLSWFGLRVAGWWAWARHRKKDRPVKQRNR